MKRINRRRFLSRSAGAGAALAAACRQAPAPATPPPAAAAPAYLEKLTLKPSILPRKTFFEPLIEAPQFDARDMRLPPRVPVRMIIRGLCAYYIHDDVIDLLLMDTRVVPPMPGHQPMPVHVGKFTVEDRYAMAHGLPPSTENGVVETDDPEYEPIRVWDIRGTRVTFTADQPFDGPKIQWVDHSRENPWASKDWQLNFDDVFPGGTLKSDIWMGAGGAVAAIVRLTHGRLESALPGCRYGNTGVWWVPQQDASKGWLQALSDTVLYSVDLPVGTKQLTLVREQLPQYQADPKDPPPTYTPIVLNGPTNSATGQPSGQILPCGIAHEPPLGQAVHMKDLGHNRVFFDLYSNAPGADRRVYPTMHRHWVDRGVSREARSAYWSVTKNPNDGQMSVNICDPNCNGAVIGAGSTENRRFLSTSEVVL